MVIKYINIIYSIPVTLHLKNIPISYKLVITSHKGKLDNTINYKYN